VSQREEPPAAGEALVEQPEESWLLPGEQEPVSETPVFAGEVDDDGDLDVPDFLR
jgi:hypothetical protein